MTASSGGWGDPGGGLPLADNPGAMDSYRDDGTYVVLMKGVDDSLKESRPRELFKYLPKVIKDIHFCRKLKSGEYLIKINKTEKEKVFKIKEVGPIKVVIEEPWNMNRTKVTIRYDDIENSSDEELTKDLKDQNDDVISAEIQTKVVDEVRVNTKFAIVTILGKYSELELQRKKLNLNFGKVNVKLYIPQPSRCKKCLMYDHWSSKNKPCPKPKLCGNCGQAFHLKMVDNKTVGTCDRPSRCYHCKQPHPVWSKLCHRYNDEKVIWDIAAKRRVSYRAATHMAENNQKERLRSYASTASIIRQTPPAPQTRPDETSKIEQEVQAMTKLLLNVMKEVTKLTKQVTKLTMRHGHTLSDSDISDDITDSLEDQSPGGFNTTLTNGLKAVYQQSLEFTELKEQLGMGGTPMEVGGEERRRRRSPEATDARGDEPVAKKAVRGKDGRPGGNNNPPPNFNANRASRRSGSSGSGSSGSPGVT